MGPRAGRSVAVVLVEGRGISHDKKRVALKPSGGLGTGAVLSHHECPDGFGYPRGLRSHEIPLEARILRVADVFSALTDARVYKAPMRRADAIERMESLAGTKLDGERCGPWSPPQ